jgi:pyruvyl transferase EpsO
VAGDIGDGGPLLRHQAATILGELLGPGSRCALVDFPMHANIGDSAIWLGERALLGGLGVEIGYTCGGASFSAQDLATRLPAGVILIHGGGNLGDLWPHHQHLRERIIRCFPTHRIIQLPQSIHFRRQATLDRARAVFNAHPDLTLLVRDRHSYQLARTEFRARTVLCPDLACGISKLPELARPELDVLWLARDDHESTRRRLPDVGAGVLVTDWTGEQGADPLHRDQLTAAHLGCHLAAHEFSLRPDDDRLRALCQNYDQHATLQLVRGCRLLSRGRSVVTDRLHGHLLSLLLGLPHVILDDRYCKIRNFWRTWTSQSPLARWADTPHEALELSART